MTLTEGFLSGNVFIDLARDIMYGSSQVNLNYPLRFATVGFQLVSTELLAEIADRIRIEAGYVPMHRWMSSGKRTVIRMGGTISTSISTSTAQAGWAAASSSLW